MKETVIQFGRRTLDKEGTPFDTCKRLNDLIVG